MQTLIGLAILQSKIISQGKAEAEVGYRVAVSQGHKVMKKYIASKQADTFNINKKIFSHEN